MIKLFNKKSTQQGQHTPFSNSPTQKEAMTSSAAGNTHVQKNAEAELGKAAGGLQDAKLPKETTKVDVTRSRGPMKASNNVMTQKQTSSDVDHKGAACDDAEQNRLSKILNFSENNRMTRNLSISRSGRHKMKKQQRLSVVEGEMFNSPDKNCGSDIGPSSPLSISGPATMV